MTDIVEVPPAPVVPPFPALGSNNYNDEAYAAGVALPGLSAGIHAIGVAARTNAVAAKEQAQAAVASKNAATAQADAAMGYRNAAQAAVGNSTTEADRARDEADRSRNEADRANAQANRAQTEADTSMGYRNAAQAAAGNSTVEANRARAEADRAADAAASIAGGPVPSVNGKTGVVLLSATDIAQAATIEEMQAGTEAGYRSLSPKLVAQAIAVLAKSKIIRSTRTVNIALGAADNGKLIVITSGTWTQTFAAKETLGNGWWCYVRNDGTGDITLGPNASDLIDGLTSYVMYPGEVRLVQCDGVALRTVVLNAFSRTFTTSGTFIKPPGYCAFDLELWPGGFSGRGGGSHSGGGGSGGYGGAGVETTVVDALVAASVTVIVGSGGIGSAGTTGTPSASVQGGDTSFGALVTASGFDSLQGAFNGGAPPGAGTTTTATSGAVGSAGRRGEGGGGAGGTGGSGSSSPGGQGGASLQAGAGGTGGASGIPNSGSGQPGGDGIAPGGGGGGGGSGGFNSGMPGGKGGNGARGELRIRGVV